MTPPHGQLQLCGPLKKSECRHAWCVSVNVNAMDVPEPELFIEEGPPVFPVANATHKSLVDGSTLESAARRALPENPHP